MTYLKNFFREDEGQDLIEYTLLLAFVCLAGAAIFIPVGTTIGNIWGYANNVTSTAETYAAKAS